MNKIESLIEKYCPNGVEYKKIKDITIYKQPSKYIVLNTKYDNSFKIPVLTAGKTFILGYTDDEYGVFNGLKNNIILVDDFTGDIKWVDFDFKVKSSATKFIQSFDNNKYSLKFIYYSLSNLSYKNNDHKRCWINTMSNFKIAVPPIQIQNEIVSILDSFAELTAELSFRKKQYEYYLNDLFDFDKNNIKYKLLKIKDVLKIKRGERITKKELKQYGYLVISGGTNPFGFYDKYNRNENTITIAQYGTAGFVNFIREKFWANDVCYSMDVNKEMNNKFVYYFFKKNQNYLYSLVVPATPLHLPQERLENIFIPIPSIEEQNRIVQILDSFNDLTTNLQIGLPKEIELRQKQYEYYRDKLLTFKELKH